MYTHSANPNSKGRLCCHTVGIFGPELMQRCWCSPFQHHIRYSSSLAPVEGSITDPVFRIRRILMNLEG